MSTDKIKGLCKQDSYTERGDRDDLPVEDYEEKEMLKRKEYQKDDESKLDEANILDRVDGLASEIMFKKVKDGTEETAD